MVITRWTLLGLLLGGSTLGWAYWRIVEANAWDDLWHRLLLAGCAFLLFLLADEAAEYGGHYRGSHQKYWQMPTWYARIGLAIYFVYAIGTIYLAT